MNIKYQDISDAMREKICSGVWGPGQRLPIRSELVKQYNTTVATLQKAMDELSADGFIISAGKRGTFVADEPPNLSTFAVVLQETASTAWEDTLWTIFVSQKRRLEKQFDLKFSLYHLEENNMTAQSHVEESVFYLSDLTDKFEFICQKALHKVYDAHKIDIEQF